MIENQIVARGVTNPTVLNAIRKVPREKFVRDEDQDLSFADQPLSIGEKQTISQPYIVALMTDSLKLESNHRVLEIGTGSGYQTAVLAKIAKEVYSVEIIKSLHEKSSKLLKELGYKNIYTTHANGFDGWQEKAPFDRIIVTAAPAQLPQTLIDQLAPGGILLLPIGTEDQKLVRIAKNNQSEISQEVITRVQFVPMTGR